MSAQIINQQSQVIRNSEYGSYLPLLSVAEVAPVAPLTYQASSPNAPLPQAPYTTQFANRTTVSAPAQSVNDPIPTPASAQSPTNQSSNGATVTAATPSVLDQLGPILAALSAGPNAMAGGVGNGVGQYSTSMPPTSAANVASLQPTGAQTSTSGPSTILIVGVVLALIVGVYFYVKHKKESS